MLDQIVADFTLEATGGQTFQLASQRGKALVIFFYPKDNTPGCSSEAGEFRDLHEEFSRLDCTVVGISRDGLKSHENFKAKLALPFELLSDKEEHVCNLFDVIKQKKLYGKEVRGIQRSTFLLDSHGVLRREWRGVKVAGHAAAVLQAVQEMQAQ